MILIVISQITDNKWKWSNLQKLVSLVRKVSLVKLAVKLKELTISMITLKKCFLSFFLHPSLQKMKRREGYKIFGLGGSLGVFVNIFFSPPRQNVLARKRIALSLSHTSPHMKNRLPSCEILISSKKYVAGMSKEYWIFYLTCWNISIPLSNIPRQSTYLWFDYNTNFLEISS